MPRKRKLTPAAVRKIYQSDETAKVLGSRHGVSQNMVYLIRSGRAHQRTTKGLVAANPPRGRRPAFSAASAKIDIDALADALIKRIVARLRAR